MALFRIKKSQDSTLSTTTGALYTLFTLDAGGSASSPSDEGPENRTAMKVTWLHACILAYVMILGACSEPHEKSSASSESPASVSPAAHSIPLQSSDPQKLLRACEANPSTSPATLAAGLGHLAMAPWRICAGEVNHVSSVVLTSERVV
jgi:hypothetical protein